MKALNSIWTFIHDNFWLVLFGTAMLVLFLFIGHFAELIYAAMKFAFVLSLAALFVHWKFPGSIHKYIVDGEFLKEFWHADLDPKHRLWITVALFVAVFVVGAWIFSNV